MELGECANEHRGFKYWSEDQEPRNKVFTMNPGENDQEAPLGGYKNPLLEERGLPAFYPIYWLGTEHHRKTTVEAEVSK
ncbi:dUTP diphosphatase [Salicibibacter cibarius]|uniref:dUTP diphosphatase n=1 Tax=Salicibibacter cibarius TaxID=2743000 RepID=UPI002483A4BD|nr:dUTP diphosphatase [Salicibibacter cibarius]